MTDRADRDVFITNLFGLKTREPLVTVRLDGEPVLQCSPAKAREIAGMLVRAAEAADQDGFIYGWAKSSGADDQRAALVMLEYRQYRDAQEGRG